MSWSFHRTNAKPKDIEEAANAYFTEQMISQFGPPESEICSLVRSQIVIAANAMPPGYIMSVSAYGSQSTIDDGDDGGKLNNLSVSISYAKEFAEPAPEGDAPLDESAPK